MKLLYPIVLIVCLAGFSPAGWAQWLPDSWSSVGILSTLLDLGAEWDGGDIREVVDNISDNQAHDSVYSKRRNSDYLRMQFILSAGRIVEQKEGYKGERPSYPGSVWQSRFRAAVKGRSYSFYTLAESDAGETKLPLSDHRSMSFELEPVRKHLKLVFGDYSVDHGLGILFSTRTVFSGWGQDPHLLLYRSQGLKANTSGNEDRFLRGGGVQWSNKGWKLTGFFSDKMIDAQLREGSLTSFHGSGYHRTASEIAFADQLDEKVQGLFVQYITDWVQTGGGYVGMDYGSEQFMRYGWYAKIKIPGGIIFGELAGSDNIGIAVCAGLSYFGSERHRFIFMFRSGGYGYFQRYSSLGSSNKLFADKRTMRMNYQMKLRWNWTYQIDLSVKESSRLKDGSITPLDQYRIRMGFSRDARDQYRLDLRLNTAQGGLSGLIRFRQEFCSSECYAICELGYAMGIRAVRPFPVGYYFAFDTGWSAGKGRLDFRVGTLIHRMDDDSPLLYRYEPDLYYQMSIPVISGSGYRSYFCTRWRIAKGFFFEAKLNRYFYLDRNSLGAGLEKIDKPFRSLVRLQLVFRPQSV
ncbi:MAG: hypothetical protein J7L96_07710 [Bacteroidales bacterium]|nr:hypothetical protein [Bacteroidales bacterium]